MALPEFGEAGGYPSSWGKGVAFYVEPGWTGFGHGGEWWEFEVLEGFCGEWGFEEEESCGRFIGYGEDENSIVERSCAFKIKRYNSYFCFAGSQVNRFWCGASTAAAKGFSAWVILRSHGSPASTCLVNPNSLYQFSRPQFKWPSDLRDMALTQKSARGKRRNLPEFKFPQTRPLSLVFIPSNAIAAPRRHQLPTYAVRNAPMTQPPEWLKTVIPRITFVSPTPHVRGHWSSRNNLIP